MLKKLLFEPKILSTIGINETIPIPSRIDKKKELTRSKSKIIFQEKRSWDNIKSRKSNISESRERIGYEPSYLNLKQNINEVITWQRNNIKEF